MSTARVLRYLAISAAILLGIIDLIIALAGGPPDAFVPSIVSLLVFERVLDLGFD